MRNPSNAKAQACFAGLAQAFSQYLQQSESVERVLIWGEVSECEKSLSQVAHQSSVENYGYFQNAGYRGMYNMSLTKIKNLKGSPHDKTLLDFIGKEELAANLFRITQTEAKIKSDGTFGQFNLEKAVESVGRDVCNTMIKISDSEPEELPLEKNISSVKKGLKETHKGLKKLDDKKRKISDYLEIMRDAL